MLNRRTFLATVTLSSLGLPGMVRGAGISRIVAGTMMSPGGPALPASKGGPEAITICAIGDLERTSAAERILMAREQSKDVDKIIEEVAAQNPDLLLLLGDQVSDGGSMVEWAYFDHLTEPFRTAKIPTLAVRGEHDYSLINNEMSDRECYARWPETRNVLYTHIAGPVAFIAIDTCFDVHSEATLKMQKEAFATKLKEYDGDPAIRGVVVFSHHPPYTNSVLRPYKGLVDDFATPFLAASKTRLFLSGHIHSYERFTHAGGEKQFVVSGGGSGPRRTVDVSDSRPFTNDVERLRKYPVRPFNYVKLTIGDDEITGEVMMAQKKGFVLGDRFSMALAR